MAELVWVKKNVRLIVIIATDNKVFLIWIWIIIIIKLTTGETDADDDADDADDVLAFSTDTSW